MTLNIPTVIRPPDLPAQCVSSSKGALISVAQGCVLCGLCQKDCDFLRGLGNPGTVAEKCLGEDNSSLPDAFNCSLCGLCTVRCPKALPIAEMFLELRRKEVQEGRGEFREHRPLLFYEAAGRSSWLTASYLPKNCTTVFFPGCALPGIRPQHTLEMYRSLKERIDNLGIVLDCCSKPSHDLGRNDDFEKRFNGLCEQLQSSGITEVVTACPSCYQVFKKYGVGLLVSLAYSHLVVEGEGAGTGDYVIHDPCTIRFETQVQLDVRTLAENTGVRLKEFEMNGLTTLCCGEGGGAGCLDSGAGEAWTQKRKGDAGETAMLTYCAGCTSRFDSKKTRHLVDILYPEISIPKWRTRPPLTYLNRLALKFKLVLKFF